MNPSHPNHTWIGRSLGRDGRYRLDKRLGGGGMGEVFLATDTSLYNRQVAIKLLKDSLVDSPEMRQRFEREVEICVSLTNEHIVKIIEAGVTSEGYPFYVMEYLRGITLGELLKDQHQLDVERSVKIVQQICSGLGSAHRGVRLPNGEQIEAVVHRDLKPDNIFLLKDSPDASEFVKIVDFGIAKVRYQQPQNQTLTRIFLGTLRYASPEQMMGARDLDRRSDIYSLGVILYEMLGGVNPFGFNTQSGQVSEASWILAHTSEAPTPLRAQPNCAGISPALEAAVMRCLEKQADRRFGSVEELSQALQSGLPSPNQGQTIVQTRSHPPQSGQEQTINKAIVPDETLVKPIPRPAPTPPQPSAPARPDGTIVQPKPDPIPTPQQPDPASPQPIARAEAKQPDGTILQPKPDPAPTPQQPDGTIVQPKPDPAPAPQQPDGTIVQPKPAPNPAPAPSPPLPSQQKIPWVKIAVGSVLGSVLIAASIYFATKPARDPQAILSAAIKLTNETKIPQAIALAQKKSAHSEVSALSADISQLSGNLAREIPANSQVRSQAQALSADISKLSTAIELYDRGKVQEAIDLVGKISPNSQINVKPLIEEWSKI